MTELRRAAKRAYNGTVVAELRALFAEESRWQRKATIARNKLAETRTRINKLSEKLALATVGITDEPDPNADADPLCPKTHKAW